ncbi:MAG: aspartate--tRNA ligase [Candidatus Magasanikbacteria bacterium]|nr:aspartate--tRNA ligase [Candidatus Magasanikbacteria bacterium]
MNRIFSIETVNKVGEEVLLKGWVNARRDMGKIAFFDLRDREGILQIVGVPSDVDEKSFEDMNRARLEYLVEIRGNVQARGAKQINLEMTTGTVEILAKEIKIISESEPMPFEINDDTKKISEELRLKYRYLDLRSERMKNNLKMRHEVNLFLRNYYSDKGFWEIETPCLTKGTPEGAREFLVPSRIYKGSFYVLPQSPQQFKQLLMVGGVEKYMQIARCFRDEDMRGDRQPEFTQLDLEVSFWDQEQIINLMEESMVELVEKFYPEKKITALPFPRLTWQEAKDKYNSDKPDLRVDKTDKNELAFAWVVDFPLFVKSKTENRLVSEHHPFTRPLDEDLPLLESAPEKVRAYCYDLILNGNEIGGGSLRIFDAILQKKIFEILGVAENDIKERFGHMLEAYAYGVPPHGGIALGLDRLMMLLQGEESIREVIAFAKTSDSRDLMVNAPSPMPETALDDVHIKLK